MTLTIGLIGGMSWESSALYYRLVNQGVRAALGGHHSARLLMLSLDFAEIAALQHAGDWDTLAERMAASGMGGDVSALAGRKYTIGGYPTSLSEYQQRVAVSWHLPKVANHLTQ